MGGAGGAVRRVQWERLASAVLVALAVKMDHQGLVAYLEHRASAGGADTVASKVLAVYLVGAVRRGLPAYLVTLDGAATVV